MTIYKCVPRPRALLLSVHSVTTGPASIISTRKHHLQLVVMDTVIAEVVVAVSFVASSVVALKVVVFKASSSAREAFLLIYSM